ncbi:hypothetical protein CHS0354_030438 [Potamilus streckersoni]|uniref:Uncharacterized protein n=1 Tax=Potamilus streckersoni TaxID=2493646 RepID=A0AAE0SHV3_9BIVA|nr:hypothetical protein CHS0354_030438 [Potamilus streckersoni]
MSKPKIRKILLDNSARRNLTNKDKTRKVIAPDTHDNTPGPSYVTNTKSPQHKSDKTNTHIIEIYTTPKYPTFDYRHEFEGYAITPKEKQPLIGQQKIKKSTITTNNLTTQHKTTTTPNNSNHRQDEQSQTQHMATESKHTNPQTTQNTRTKKEKKNRRDRTQNKHITPISKTTTGPNASTRQEKQTTSQNNETVTTHKTLTRQNNHFKSPLISNIQIETNTSQYTLHKNQEEQPNTQLNDIEMEHDTTQQIHQTTTPTHHRKEKYYPTNLTLYISSCNPELLTLTTKIILGQLKKLHQGPLKVKKQRQT